MAESKTIKRRHMKLRKLQPKDAPLMLEWMHDPTVVENLQTNFAEKTLEDCLQFIDNAADSELNLHMAITDDNDEYMGTVSLKHIGQGIAEFAITVRSIAQGKGYAQYGMQEILAYGIHDLGLKAVYWCVSPENGRAVRFYDKNNYVRTEEIPDRIRQFYHQQFIWYVYR